MRLSGPLKMHALLLPDARALEPLAALIPIDADTQGRIETLTRFWRSTLKRPIPTDTRMTPMQRQRLRRILQAVDGRLNGATYREIAEVLFGIERLSLDHWKSSSLRDTTIDLVRDGYRLIGGGYHRLLRHRRRSL